MTETRNLIAVGHNDEQTNCDRCGKVELKGTVILAEDGVEVGRYGTTCATKELQAANPAATKVTRSYALTRETDRRQRVTGYLRRANQALAENDPAIAQWHLWDMRRDALAVPHRADELAIVDRVDATGTYTSTGTNRTPDEIRAAYAANQA